MSSPTEDIDRVARPAERWSRLSRLLSWATALIGVGFIALFAWQAGMFSLLMPGEPAVPPVIPNPKEVTTSGARLSGFDKDNKPYTISAAKGHQDGSNSDLFILEDLTAEIQNKTGAVFNVTAARGTYDRRDDGIMLSNGVTVVQGGKLTARMPEAKVMMKQKTITADRDVVVTMLGGEIRAQGMRVTNDANNILFFNGVRATFEQSTATGGQNP